MQALVSERKDQLCLRDIAFPSRLGPTDVLIAVHTVGICGTDFHYNTHGRIGSYLVEEPMVLGHEGAGTILGSGSEVAGLKVGDPICMEPEVPNLISRASKLGLYNVDPAVTFWATPPVHGILTPKVIHRSAFTYRLPDNVSYAEAAMVEPLAAGMQTAARAHIAPGDVAVVVEAGTIGIMVALAALAGGCSEVIISDLSAERLAIEGCYPGITLVDICETDLVTIVAEKTNDWGVDLVFEASGSGRVFDDMLKAGRAGGCIVLIGLPFAPVQFDVSKAISKEERVKTVFRCANVFNRALALIVFGKVDLQPLVTKTYRFSDNVVAFQRAAEGRPGDVKLQIIVDSGEGF